MKESTTKQTIDSSLSRRDFLKVTGGGIIIFFTVGDLEELWLQRGRREYPEEFNAYLRIGEDNRVECLSGKIEMGQGAITALAQLLADELDVSLDSVDMIMGDTDRCVWDMGTFGSRCIRYFGPPLRAAAAEARAVLLEIGSERLQVPKSRLQTENGVIFDKENKTKRITYGEIAKGQKIQRYMEKKPEVKSPDEFKIINKPVFHRDAAEKVTGHAKFAGDIRLSDMLYAGIVRPPAHGARLKSVDTSAVKKMKDIILVEEDDLIAVLHETPDGAANALKSIKAEYDVPEPEVNDKTIFDHLLKVAPEGRTRAEEGNLQEGEKISEHVFEETYLNSYVAHSPIEPHTAVAEIKDNKAALWVSTQAPFRVKDQVARVLNIPAENVRILTPFVGGGFGGKTRSQQALEAARLAKIAGRPVQVAWSRQEEFFYDTFRPAAVVKIKSGIDNSGKVLLWDYNVYFAGDRGSVQFYNIPHHRTVVTGSWGGGEGVHPFDVGAWRAPAVNTNTFARESQIDIMAAKAGVDPLEFRMKNLNNDRMKRVLKAAADKFGWTPVKIPSGRGVAIVCADYLDTYIAAAAEVAVDKKSGNVRVKRVVCAQDMGLVVNPQGATIQIEGCITMGLGYTLSEEIQFRSGEILNKNFDSYELPRFSWVPEIEVVLIDEKDKPALGCGEPAIVLMGGLIANAIFDACGARLFQLPMTQERVKEALKKV